MGNKYNINIDDHNFLMQLRKEANKAMNKEMDGSGLTDKWEALKRLYGVAMTLERYKEEDSNRTKIRKGIK